MPKSWVYHETKTAKIIDDVELEDYLADGWAESPADVGNKSEPESCDLSGFTKTELIDFAKKKYGKTCSMRMNHAELVEEIMKFETARNETKEDGDGA